MLVQTERKRDAAYSKAYALYCARAVEDKKAEDILIFDLTDVEGAPATYFVLCSCLSEVQVDAVSAGMERAGKDAGQGLPKSEGWDAKQWVILDYFDVVVHVFHQDARDFYRLEKLWSEADFYTLQESKAVKMNKTAKTALLNDLQNNRRIPARYAEQSSGYTKDK